MFSGRCYNHQVDVMPVLLADVLPICFCMWQMLLPFFLWQMYLPLLCLVWQMLLPYSLLADVIAIVYVLLYCVADVIATVADDNAIL